MDRNSLFICSYCENENGLLPFIGWTLETLNRPARFRRVLFATDFTPESLAAAPYAISLAQENEAQLILLTVIDERDRNMELR